MISSSLTRTLGLCLLLLPALSPAADDWLKLPDGKAEMIEEPVFGDKIWIYQAGKKNTESIVLIHGLGHSGADDWKTLIPELARHYHVVTLDLPGFGRSAQGNRLYTPSTYARVVDFLVDRYVKGPLHVVGHSMGGAIAARYTALNPKRVKTLTLVDAAGILHRIAFQKALTVGAVEKNIPPIFATQDSTTRDLVSAIMDMAESYTLGPELVLNTPPLRQTFLKGDPLRIAALGLVLEDYSDLAWKLKLPVLVIWGDRDSVAPIRSGKVLDEVLPRADLVVLPGTAHNPMIQSPKLLLKAMTPFLAGKRSVDDQPAVDKVSTQKVSTPLDCNNQINMTIPPGSYGHISITGCKGLVMKNVRTTGLTIRDSDLEMENVIVDGGQTAVDVAESVLIITNGRISGETVFKAESSRVDLAGTHLIAREQLIASTLPSSFIFSIVLAETPAQRRYLHQYIKTSLINSL